MKTLVATITSAVLISTSAMAAPAQEEVGFEDYSGVTGSGRVVEGATPYLGQYKKPLGDEEFYRAIGRDDLAAQYEANVSRDHWVGATGVGVMLAGIGGGVGVALSNCAHTSEAGCSAGGVALGGFAVGIGALLIGVARRTDDNPVDLPARRQLADEHNQSLRINVAPNGLEVNF
jgi:opacity protein-like surface antigen